MVRAAAKRKFLSIQESSDPFLALFPHRYDYIWASHPDPGVKPDWQTESRYPLSDRAIQQGSCLYGVRFGKETRYALLDIDIQSHYHPRQDPLAIGRITHTLEALGLVNHIALQSSNSGGLHLYFPFEEAQSSWKISLVISTLLENAGFKIYPGQLEIFPNPRPYLVEGKPNLFNAHRLPLQLGSYLLDRDYQPVSYAQARLVEQWRYALQRNDVQSKALDRLLRQLQRRCFKLSGKADKFLNDLNSEIEVGWTGQGQTNRLLGRIAMRTYVFHHVIAGGEPLTGNPLIEQIIRIARSLPGYQDWCQHQHEIEHRAAEWASCVENSHYFHYGHDSIQLNTSESAKPITKASWNQQRLEDTRDRIKKAIAELLNQNKLPAKATDRFKELLAYGVGGGSLYRHKDLWHPEFLINQNQDSEEKLGKQSNHEIIPNLLSANDGNANVDSTPSDVQIGQVTALDNNLSLVPSSINAIDIETWCDIQAAATMTAGQNGSAASSLPTLDRIQSFLSSDDPILLAQAYAWLNQYTGLITPVHLQPDREDLSELLMRISVHIARLRWDKSTVQQQLQRHFGKACQTLLNPAELRNWLTFLEVIL
jgi:hypothetical protein